MNPLAVWREPGREFDPIPFWFWNDRLDEAEIVRQIADFDAHGVAGFVIHPRVGLPPDTGWMSERLLHFMRVALAEARRRGLTVVLYDEGMYPSGSASGQVVAENPAFACRGLAKRDNLPVEGLTLAPGHNLVAVVSKHDGQEIAVIDRPVNSVIRGLHYVGEGPKEETPPAADLLNPEAVAAFIRLVYDRYAAEFGDDFGNTIQAIFTDEPDVLGRLRERERVLPGTTGILDHVNAFLGYDFTPHLPALWSDDEPDASQHRADYHRAIMRRLEQTYYAPLRAWCDAHGVLLTGHPAQPDDLGLMRYFHIPGQDLVWRWVLPDTPSALEGPQSTQAKCSSSAMIHLGRRLNSNECFGAYGHELTWAEMTWLADWCFVRGVNRLYPHAFYYSVRGPRRDERPPDVGPNSPWWPEYPQFADRCRRLCWLNTDSRHVCHIAILGESDRLPWAAAKVCFQRQRDFNYLELRHLWEDAAVTPDGTSLAGMHYGVLIIDGIVSLPPEARPALGTLARAGRLVAWGGTASAADLPGTLMAGTEDELVAMLDRLVPPDVTLAPAHSDLRYRHVVKDGHDWYLLFNEGSGAVHGNLQVSATGERCWLDPVTGQRSLVAGDVDLHLRPYETKVLLVGAGGGGN